MAAPDKPSKGVRKLRDAEAKAGHQIVMERQKEMEEEEEELSNTAVLGQYPPEQARRVGRLRPVQGQFTAADAHDRARCRLITRPTVSKRRCCAKFPVRPA
jgi:hypothetical protein